MNISIESLPEGLKKEIYDIVFQAIGDTQVTRKSDLPYLLERKDLEVLFQCSSSHLQGHIIRRPDFPVLRLGKRVVYPRDMVFKWIEKQTQQGMAVQPFQTRKEA